MIGGSVAACPFLVGYTSTRAWGYVASAQDSPCRAMTAVMIGTGVIR